MIDPTVWYLHTCSTCSRIISDLNIKHLNFDFREIKTTGITAAELDYLATISGSYASLFSKKAVKFRERNLHNENLLEDDYRRLILEEYTFLKRPVFLYNNEVFIGNSKAVIESLKQKIEA